MKSDAQQTVVRRFGALHGTIFPRGAQERDIRKGRGGSDE